jgi:hypothetical protein
MASPSGTNHRRALLRVVMAAETITLEGTAARLIALLVEEAEEINRIDVGSVRLIFNPEKAHAEVTRASLPARRFMTVITPPV